MKKAETHNEKPNVVRRKYLSPDEATDLRWSDFDLEGRPRVLHVRRIKGSQNSIHTCSGPIT